MENHYKLSIIILTYNSRQNVEQLLESIKNQTFKDYEIIVVDNASQDETVKFIKDNYPKIKIIINPENYWYAKGNNIGIRQTQGEYVLICNDDIKLDTNCLQWLIEDLDKEEEIGVITGKIMRLTDDSDYSIVDCAGLKRTIYRKFSNIGENQEDKGQFDNYQDIFGVSGAFFLARKKALDSIKYKQEYFDEDFIAYKEDIDLSYRLRHKGWKIKYEPKAVIWHKRSIKKDDSRKNKNKLIKAYSYRNHLWVLLKNEKITSGIFILPYELLKFIYILIFELYTLKIFCKSFKDIKKILKKRHAIIYHNTQL
jgi:GT2 family glycosyltransferase